MEKPLFSKVFSTGRSFHTTAISLKIMSTEGPSRFAVTAGKAAAVLASKRNTLRRRGYSILRKHKGQIRSGTAAIFIIKKEMSFKETEKEILFLLSKAGVI